MERVENRQEYHDVVAEAQRSIVRLLAASKNNDAKQLITYCIRQAYTIYRLDDDENLKEVMDSLEKAQTKDKKEKQVKKSNLDIDHIIEQELKDMKLDEMDTDPLITKMFSYQTLAGIKPVQTYKQRARVFAMRRGDL